MTHPPERETVHRITPLVMSRAQMLAICGMDPTPPGGFRPLPSSSALALTEPAQTISLKEPALRLLRPLIDWCVQQCAELGITIDWLALGVGEYEGLPPEALYRRMMSAVRHHEHYTRQARGDHELLSAHADWLSMITGFKFASEDSMLTSGCLDACRNMILYFSKPGDLITFVGPHWINSYTMALAYQRRAHMVLLDWRTRYRRPQTWQEWDEVVPKGTKILWLEAPGNPHGMGWQSVKEMEAVAEFVERRAAEDPEFIGVADEEYRLLYEALRPMTILSVGAKRIVTVSSWDKTFCITSARLGSMESADPVVRKFFQSLANLHLSAPDFMHLQGNVAELLRDRTEQGALAYLTGLSREIKANRDLCDRVMHGCMGKVVRGDAAFYNTWVLEELRAGGPVQAMLHSLLLIAQALRERRDPGIEVYTDAVPLAGFFHGGKGPSGFRLTLGRSAEQGLEPALRGLMAIVERYLAAGQPYYGDPKEIVAAFLGGAKIEAKSWPT